MIQIQTPKQWRLGQTIFNFLRWLQVEKKYEGYDGEDFLADPFHIDDDELQGYYKEYLEYLKERE